MVWSEEFVFLMEQFINFNLEKNINYFDILYVIIYNNIMFDSSGFNS